MEQIFEFPLNECTPQLGGGGAPGVPPINLDKNVGQNFGQKMDKVLDKKWTQFWTKNWTNILETFVGGGAGGTPLVVTQEDCPCYMKGPKNLEKTVTCRVSSS